MTDYLLVRESLPRQVDKSLGSLRRRRKESGVLKEEIGVWNSQGGGKDEHVFSLHFLILVT